jgi:hypothetical protein
VTDVRLQLTEALDRMERVFKHEHAWTCAINAEDAPACDCGLAGLMARLIERDRKLLAQYRLYENERYPDSNGGYANALEDQIEAAAEAWLGTKEGQNNG